MNTSHLSPQTYRGFLVNELLRNGPLLKVMESGGHVFAHLSTGREQLSELADKLLRELDELENAETAENIWEEIGDLKDVTALTESVIGDMNEADAHHYVLDLTELTGYLAFFQYLLEEAPSLPDALLHRYLRRLLWDVDNYINANIPYLNDEVDALRSTKALCKGDLSGWFAEVIFLRKEDAWCAYYAGKYEEITDSSACNPAMALIPDHIYRHVNNLQNRHPPG